MSEDDVRHEQRTAATCRRCGRPSVVVAPFTWSAERYLQWRCEACNKGWATPERRLFDRRTGATSSDRHRSEEHTSELQSQSNLVCRLLLEKKKKKKKHKTTKNTNKIISEHVITS